MPRGLTPPSAPLADDLILLEPLDERFVPNFAQLLEDEDIVRFTRVPSNAGPGFAEAWVGRYVTGWDEGSRAGFAILSHDGEFLGMAAIVDLDLAGRQGEIGYMVAEAARGRGVAGRSLELVTRWALGSLGLERVELRISTDNGASVRVAERAGYHREGILRSQHLKEDIRGDVVIYSLLRSD